MNSHVNIFTSSLREYKMSRRKTVKVRIFPGTTIYDIKFFAVLLLKSNQIKCLKTWKNLVFWYKKWYRQQKVISSLLLRVDKATSDNNNKSFKTLLNSSDWDCIHLEKIEKSHLNEYCVHINRAWSTNLAKNLISRIRKFWYDLDSKNKRKKCSPPSSVTNSDRLELDLSFKSHSVKSSVG